jgi:transcriptional regulator with XRE-family HTH domain
MLSFLPKNPTTIQEELKNKFRVKRKELKITQNQLALKSDVSLGSIKRFERSGQISLESFLKIAFILECLDDFKEICIKKDTLPNSIEELLVGDGYD